MLNTLIVGASGYAGAELVTYINRHPHMNITALTVSAQSNDAGKLISDLHPQLKGIVDMPLQPMSDISEFSAGVDVVYLATAHEVSHDLAPQFLAAGCVVFDLSGAFRVNDGAFYEKYYGFTHQHPDLLEKAVYGLAEWSADKLKEALMDANKLEREENVAKVKAEIAEVFIEKYPDNAKDVAYITQKLVKKIVRRTISVDKIRPDGRQLDEVRPVTCEVGLLARPHGSALFTRGQTQILNVLALAPLREAQILDGLGVEDTKRYIHHYNFPPYSVGETKPMRSPGRREIGHGALAERALLPVIPSEDEFPYAIRLVSETLESNGSSSMGSVCASTLSLMDAGVPIKAPVAGVAMGLVKDGEYFTILTDIQGLEDALGDMDFKVAGTDKGITAIQMDIKIDGINKDIFTQALAQAKRGRDHIMGIMMECISEPRKELSQYAPKITTISVDPEKISKVIGPGGKMIKKIVEETGAKIDIDDSGKVFIAAVNSESAAKAIDMIHGIVADAEVGKVYTGKVTRLMNFGAFVEILPGKEGLVHISQLSTERVGKVEDVVSVGDEIVVKVTEIDQKGRINLSRKAVLANGLEK